MSNSEHGGMTSTPDMANRRLLILDAAEAVFLRYGFARTTMADIASEAGLSRPNLYVSFPDKTEIYQAVLGRMVLRTINVTRAQLPRSGDLGERLFQACISWTRDGFELVRANRDARDLFDPAIPAVRDAYVAFEAFLDEVLTEANFAGNGALERRRVVAMMSTALKGFKDMACDSNELQNLIRTMTTAVAHSQTDTGEPGGQIKQAD